ncbi:hypothetical protein BDV95DRAFT_473215, partial [Massariosphaeria phaeospora]
EDPRYNHSNDNGILSMHKMQRFLLEPSPSTPTLLHAGLDRSLPLQSQHLQQYEQQWPSVDAYRISSPDRSSMSTNSSHGTQNELRSPHPYHSLPYDSPMECSQSTRAYLSSENFGEVVYPSELPQAGASISLRELEYEHHEPEAVVEDHGQCDLKPEGDYDQEPTYTKIAPVPDTYSIYPDSGIGNSVRAAEEVLPMEEDASDSDYKPSSRTKKQRRSSTASDGSSRQGSRRRHGRKNSSTSNQSDSNRVKKRRPSSNTSTSMFKAVKDSTSNDTLRPFPCPLAGYGCQSNFVSKNEWKRHVSTQHIKLGFWRCDLCATTVDPRDDQTIYHNDFNRKDLFTQHLRRMHAAPVQLSARTQKEYPVTEDNIVQHQKRCYQVLRDTPPQSGCPFCDHTFSGPTSWDARQEHVGRHLEKDRKSGGAPIDIATWKKDKMLEQWLLDEGLIAHDRSGAWKLGDGKPLRSFASDDSGDDE